MRLIRLLAVFVLVLASGVRGDDAFYRVSLGELTITEGAIPKPEETTKTYWQLGHVMRPYAVLDGAGEVYTLTEQSLGEPFRGQWETSETNPDLFIRASAGEPVVGSLYLLNSDRTGMVALRFTVPTSAAKADARRDFYRAKESHYLFLQSREAPGSAWFRRQATEAYRVLVKDNPDYTSPVAPMGARDLTSTYDLFVGGRALSENLQLMRDLPAARQPAANPEPDEKPVPIASIEGVTVAAFDWTKLLSATKPATDPLADVIPADQHAVFFPSFDAIIALLDETTDAGLPIFRGLGERSEDGRLIERYQRQLCLDTGAVARLLGPKVISSVAVTGSDPYFPLGTDVAVLFEGADSSALRELLTTQIKVMASATPGAAAKSGEIDGVAYSAVVSEDRAVCSYLCVIGRAVVVTNSLVQVQRLAAVKAGKAPAMAALPEYQFFRSRYPLGAEGQTGMLLISDAAIRRWCGAEWRIGASRRLRAAAILADVTAAHMDDLVGGVKEQRGVESDTPMRTIGTLTMGAGGVRSSVYGTSGFMTPIAELGITEVAPDEAAGYKRWRDTYQRNWSWAFDPIAATFSVQKSKLSADLTVMPLIVGSQYRTWIDVARGASIAVDAGDPHDSIAHAVFALNVEAPALKNSAGMVQMFVPGVEIDPLGWLGHSVAIYADPDPFWGKMAAAAGKADDSHFFEEELAHVPVAVYAEVGSALKMTAFVAAARGAIEQAAPGMAAWETRTHNGQAYVRVGLTEKAKAESRGEGWDKAALYYAATPRALILSLREDVLKRAIDRQTARVAKPGAVPAQPWLGSSMCLRVTREGLELLGIAGKDSYREEGQRKAWSNIAILNEWKRRYPEKDPVEVHLAHFGTRPICPGGGKYVWNEKFKTMESTVYGHPGEPKAGPNGLGPLEAIRAGDFGLTFENQGLRARAVIERGAGK